MLFLNDNVVHDAMNLKLMDIVQCFPSMQHFVDTFKLVLNDDASALLKNLEF